MKKRAPPPPGSLTIRTSAKAELVNTEPISTTNDNSADANAPAKELFHIAAIDKLRVYVSVPEIYDQAAAPGTKATLTLDEFPGRSFQGSLVRNANAIDLASRTLLVEVDVANPDGILRPGQFGRVRVQTQILRNALLIPQAAVNEIQGTYQVVVLGSGNRAEMRPVTVGPRVGTDWVIEVGLKPGEQVIVVGTQRVRAGLTVQPKPYQQPKN